MNKKITITLPEYLINIIDERIGRGEKSKFISQAIEEKLLSGSDSVISKGPVEDFYNLRNQIKTKSIKKNK